MSANFNRWLLLAGLVVVALVAAMACSSSDDNKTTTSTPKASGQVKTDVGVSATEIKLGLTIVQSGSLAAVYQPILPTVQAYFKKINTEQQGVCGRQLTLVAEDDQYSPALGLEKAKKLVEQDKVAAFMGNLGTPPNTNSAPYINEQKVPDLWLATGVPGFADATKLPYTTLYNPDYISEGKILGKYVKDNFAGKTVAVLHQNDDFGKSGRDGFLTGWGGTYAKAESYESTATGIDSQMANLRSSNADILYLYSTPAFTARAFAYMKANNWKPQVVESYVNSATTLASLVGGGTTPDQVKAGFAQIAGTLSSNYILDPVADANDPAIVAHKEMLTKYGGPAFGTLTVFAEAVAETDVKTLQIACDNGDLTRQGIMTAAESLKDFHPTVLLKGININTSKTDHAAIQSLLPVTIQADGTLKGLAPSPISVE